MEENEGFVEVFKEGIGIGSDTGGGLHHYIKGESIPLSISGFQC